MLADIFKKIGSLADLLTLFFLKMLICPWCRWKRITLVQRDTPSDDLPVLADNPIIPALRRFLSRFKLLHHTPPFINSLEIIFCVVT